MFMVESESWYFIYDYVVGMERLINSYAQNSWVNIFHWKINIARKVFKIHFI